MFRGRKLTDNQVLRFVASTVIVSAIVFVYFHWLHVNPTTVGFTLLLAVLLISAAWGLRHALFTVITATVACNYFFLPPLFRFTVADPQNWISLFAFLVTAVIASQLSERVRRGMAYADQRRHEVEKLNANWFTSLSDARRKIETWRQDYNEQRPHSSLNYLPPAEFARKAAEITE